MHRCRDSQLTRERQTWLFHSPVPEQGRNQFTRKFMRRLAGPLGSPLPSGEGDGERLEVETGESRCG